MKGYLKNPQATDDAFAGGWFHTGDLGVWHPDNYIELKDRSKDIIISGGENISSIEVEDALYKHPAVSAAAVVARPDEKWGEAVYATVVPRQEHSNIDPEELLSFCREQIAGYKVPKGIDIRHEPLPISGPGKVLKRELRAPFWEGVDRAVN